MQLMASDLLILAAKAYINGNKNNAARLFVQACSTQGIDMLIRINGALASTKANLSKSDVSEGAATSFLDNLNSVKPISKSHINDALKVIRSVASSTLDMDICPKCETEPCSCSKYDEDGDSSMTDEDDFDIDGQTEENLTVASDILGDIQTALLRLKLNPEEVNYKKYIPILLNIFPDILITGNTRTSIKILVNAILNRLRDVGDETRIKLHKVLLPLVE